MILVILISAIAQQTDLNFQRAEPKITVVVPKSMSTILTSTSTLSTTSTSTSTSTSTLSTTTTSTSTSTSTSFFNYNFNFSFNFNYSFKYAQPPQYSSFDVLFSETCTHRRFDVFILYTVNKLNLPAYTLPQKNQLRVTAKQLSESPFGLQLSNNILPFPGWIFHDGLLGLISMIMIVGGISNNIIEAAINPVLAWKEIHLGQFWWNPAGETYPCHSVIIALQAPFQAHSRN